MNSLIFSLILHSIVTAPIAGYRGRFAPTPSGPLHLGSLFTALASWLSARQAGGEWWLRIDDLDRPRCVAGAETLILQQLEAHGLHWDGTPVRQSEHEEDYRAALRQLDAQQRLYACTCTRATLALSTLPGPDGPIYPGSCRGHPPAGDTAHALRFQVQDGVLQWLDGIQGRIGRALPQEAGDFVVCRADGQIGYHLACALDEQRMGITEVVRGADLLGATVQQLQVLHALQLTPPRYAHVPVLLASDGHRKLSKQNGAAPIATDARAAGQQLYWCLAAMRLEPPAPLLRASVQEILQWAVQHWQRRQLSGVLTLAALP